ncbi:OLC1v1017125C1 [Oldenlandia corymbosa var. corymbosa]|uniref:OLC1v1017125C1 n=1 Tax=Oldenlandia corymbosa var. corymbosa TaxID=529605 RepID=A0AAV1E8Q6_OLDCO|nr:OLC1v1017125C1 [Oldenlandia corymbosa var. corymbosa]
MERVNFRDATLNIEQCRRFVRNILQTKGAKPFDFVRTAPRHDPQALANESFSGHCRNPQTESFLQLLELEYLLDYSIRSKEQTGSLASRGHPDYDTEDIPIEDVDDEEEELDEENDT